MKHLLPAHDAAARVCGRNRSIDLGVWHLRTGIRSDTALHRRGQVEMLQAPVPPARASMDSVRFNASARTAWHTYPLGQTLVVTAGVDRVQRLGGSVLEIRAGDVVHIPLGLKHWHGAATCRDQPLFSHRDPAVMKWMAERKLEV